MPPKPIAVTFTLDSEAFEQELDAAVVHAKGLYIEASIKLGISVDIDKFRPSQPKSSDIKDRLAEVFKDPTKRHLITAYESSREALSTLLTFSTIIRFRKGVVDQFTLFSLFSAFRNLGIASYCIFDKYIQEDHAEVLGLGKIQAESKRKSDNSKGGKNKKGKLKTYFESILPNYAGSHIDDVLRVIYMAVQGYAKENNLKPLSITVITKKSDFTRGMKLLKDKWIKNAPNNQIIYGEKTPSTSRLKIKK